MLALRQLVQLVLGRQCDGVPVVSERSPSVRWLLRRSRLSGWQFSGPGRRLPERFRVWPDAGGLDWPVRRDCSDHCHRRRGDAYRGRRLLCAAPAAASAGAVGGARGGDGGDLAGSSGAGYSVASYERLVARTCAAVLSDDELAIVRQRAYDQ